MKKKTYSYDEVFVKRADGKETTPTKRESLVIKWLFTGRKYAIAFIFLAVFLFLSILVPRLAEISANVRW